MKTSQSHPLRIDEVRAPGIPGVIGITFCPGKCDHKWARNLAQDLDVIARWKPQCMLTLIEDHEFQMLRVPELGARVRALQIQWLHLPIVDVHPPDDRFTKAWSQVGPGLLLLLREGGRVLVHCRGGLGRAGTVAALLLVGLGVAAPDAIRLVRRARPGAIETSDQERFVLNFMPHGLGAPGPVPDRPL